MAPRVEPGTHWMLRKGQHAGTIIEVEGQTTTGNVKFRTIRGGDSSPQTDIDGRIHTIPLDRFFTLYQHEGKAAASNTQSAFRQNNKKLKQMQLDPQAEAEAILLGGDKPVPNGHYVDPGRTGGLGIAVELITPHQAQVWLERGGANRKINERSVGRLVRAIQLGEWDLTGETIKLDADGRVRDGQHRLTAILRAGIAVPCIVVRGVAESAFTKIDTGKSRNMADVLSIHGHANPISLATAARGLIIIERYGRYEVGSVKLGYAAAPSNAEGLAYVEAHPEVKEAVKEADRLRKEGKFLGGTGLWAIALTMFWRLSPQQTQTFVDLLVEGANLEHGSPVLKLRNMYRGNSREWHSTTENRERLLATVIKGWNAWRSNQLVQHLSWHNTGRAAERFPVAE